MAGELAAAAAAVVPFVGLWGGPTTTTKMCLMAVHTFFEHREGPGRANGWLWRLLGGNGGPATAAAHSPNPTCGMLNMVWHKCPRVLVTFHFLPTSEFRTNVKT